MEKKLWKLRAVQLDLARQIETLDFIHHFIDFIREYGYNALVLYLEGRIKTKSFPYPRKEESYTPEEMEEIVEYAASRSIEVIPVVSNFAHAELFLQYPKLQNLAELREGIPGRFSNDLDTFCPSLKETYQFFEAYLSEIAQIFPSPYFHVGNDEVWDIGFCSLCRGRIKNGETQAEIFAQHLLKTHKIIGQKLGKKMIVWDDMFEFYPEALGIIPKDIILCCWQYDSLVDVPRTHFGNRLREDRFALYEKLGFDYLFAPVESHPGNIESFSRYAAKYKPLGGLVTSWEKMHTFLFENYPNIAFAGKLWTEGSLGNSEEVFKRVCRELFGIEDRAFLDGIWTLKNLEKWSERTEAKSFLRGPVTPYESERSKAVAFLEVFLQSFMDKVPTEMGKDVLADIIISLKRERIQHKLRFLIPEIYSRLNKMNKGDIHNLVSQVRDLLQEIVVIKELRKSQWEKFRKSIQPAATEDFYGRFYQDIVSFLQETERENENTGLLNIRYFLPHPYSRQEVTLSIQYQGESGWEELYSGVPKPLLSDFGEIPFYTYTHLISQTRIPQGLRIETSGYGGIGLTFVEAVNCTGLYRPAEIERIKGKVWEPENLLVDDSRWSYLGEKDTRKIFLEPELAEKKHSVEIIFSKGKKLKKWGQQLSLHRDPGTPYH